MSSVAALHQAARRFCIEREAGWRRQYGQLTARGEERITRSDGSWDYTDRARDLFPRYTVLAAILAEVEQFEPEGLGTLSEARALLAAAAGAVRDLPRHDHPIEAAAIAAERQHFAEFVSAFDPSEAGSMPQIPYRRVFGEQERERTQAAFCMRWGTWSGGYADARAPASDPSVTLHVQAMQASDAYDRLRQAIAARGIDRVIELREWGSSYFLALELASFRYDGAEGFWTVPDFNWMVYASHEASITLGGVWLIEQMRQMLPDFDRYIYKGWDLAAYR